MLPRVVSFKVLTVALLTPQESPLTDPPKSWRVIESHIYSEGISGAKIVCFGLVEIKNVFARLAKRKIGFAGGIIADICRLN